MLVSVECDCGADLVEDFEVGDEASLHGDCGDCGRSFVATVTMLGMRRAPAG